MFLDFQQRLPHAREEMVELMASFWRAKSLISTSEKSSLRRESNSAKKSEIYWTVSHRCVFVSFFGMESLRAASAPLPFDSR